jgi:COP9 signalosome complex subunit 5
LLYQLKEQVKTERRNILIMKYPFIETRVNAQQEAYEYMSSYTLWAKEVNRPENVIGWYHSHPGYGCWLSGIDVDTQMQNQQYQDPFVAIVVDPTRTISAGKVNIGAFRTYPKGHKAESEAIEYQPIPLNKIEDFGVHCKQYYPLEVSFFKSSLDKRLLEHLWNRYWVSTLRFDFYHRSLQRNKQFNLF